MKKRNWKELAKELQELMNYGGYEGTKVEVKVVDDALEIVAATKYKDTFYHPEVLTDFCRCKMLSTYATIKSNQLVYRVY